jgi:hypothetical protein
MSIQFNSIRNMLIIIFYFLFSINEADLNRGFVEMHMLIKLFAFLVNAIFDDEYNNGNCVEWNNNIEEGLFCVLTSRVDMHCCLVIGDAAAFNSF